MYDKATLDKIIEILRDEKRTLEDIGAVQEKKCNLLAEAGPVNIDPLDREELELVAHLNALEKERLYTGNHMVQSSEPMTLKTLIGLVGESDKGELIAMQRELNLVIHRLQFLKSVTQALLQDKLDLVNVQLAAARGETGDVEYTEAGETVPVTTGAATPLIINRQA